MQNFVMVPAMPSQVMVAALKQELLSLGRPAEALAAAIKAGALEQIDTLEITFQWPRADAMERLLALEPNAGLLKRWQGLKAEPLRKLEIDRSGGAIYECFLFDTDDGAYSVGPVHDDPYAAADWCERNGFAWEVVVGATGDPLVALAAWRAGKCR